ncbi:MAG TPA: hypothetical protein VKG92_07360, partial [Flavobacteriales bacterium]|nr:hypothetical protein [Flavobacteriales bacterium]
MTPHISTLTPAGALGAAAAWPDEREALLGRLLWHIHTPYAQAFVATANEAVLGIGCCIVHATSGRITLLRAQDDASRTALAAALVAHLETAGATTQLITVTEEDVSFWSALGFVAQGNLIRYTGGRFLQATRDEVIHLEPFHRMAVMRQDKQATGEDRGTWLWEHAYLGRVYAER